jgi:eukaryotic-like serine/threonine-protein kinase
MSAASPANAPLLHNRYRIRARLGEGRLATVYQAEDERLKRTVLVHILRVELAQQPNLRQRFEEEAQRGAQRSHPGLLEVYDSGDVNGRPYMVTEDISGGTALADAGTLSPSEALSTVRTIVSAVALAQTQGVPHPPVSSRNVWLLTGGRTVLLENWTLAPNEIPLDLAAYRAPERVTGAPPSPATSVYALGVLAWEAFVGRRPFSGTTVDAIAQQQRRDLPPVSTARPNLFSPELDRIVGQAAAADPTMRYPTPTDFGRALDHYADASTAQTGRLAALPYAISEPLPAQQPEPITTQTRRPSRLPLRRQAKSAAPAVAPPPPPPLITAPPPPQTRTIAVQPQPDQQAIDRQIKREVRREVRRQGCQRAIVKRSFQLLTVFLLLYGAWLGIQFAVDSAAGRLQQINVGQWIAQQLPDPNDFIPSWLRDPGSLIAQYRITQATNLRSGPGVDNEVVRLLEPGVVVQALGPPDADPNGDPYQWTQVVTLDDGTRGYIADLPARAVQQ